MYVQQQRMNKVQICTGHFAGKSQISLYFFFFGGGGVLDNLLQIQLRIIQKMTENRFTFVFLILNLAYNYVVVQFYPQFNFYFPLF